MLRGMSRRMFRLLPVPAGTAERSSVQSSSRAGAGSFQWEDRCHPRRHPCRSLAGLDDTIRGWICVTRLVRLHGIQPGFFSGITFSCFRPQSCEECCDESCEECCQECCECKYILGIFFSGITFASFRAQSCEECCEESFEECCEECCEECASHCSITVDFQQDVDFPTEMRGFQVRDATRH